MRFWYVNSLILSIMLFITTGQALFAQTKLPADAATGMISYKFKLETDRATKSKVLLRQVADWFKQNAEVFTRSNTVDTGHQVMTDKKRNESKEAVQQQFANTKPLQSIDPESDRLSGKGIIKYTGLANGCIRLFYVQYNIVITVSDGVVTGDISNFRYSHFNPRTYQSQPVFNWSGSMPCDNVNTVEYIRDCEACHSEFNTFYTFLNTNAEEVINNLKTFMKSEKGITMNTDLN